VVAYFFWFAGGGLWARFTGDDLMNLNFHLTPSFPQLLLSNLTYWTTAYRPMGGILYALIYRLTGFHPMPFRIVCFAILLVNLWLLYRVCLRLTERREIALLATLLATYHAWMVNLYYSTGTIYELLCFLFYFAAFDYYLGIRRTGQTLKLRQWVVFLALYICALNSKELAVTLPVCILCYEVIWHESKASARGVTISALVTLPFVIGKLTGPDSLTANPLYRPAISASKYLHTFHLYLNVLFYQDHFFRDANTILLVVAMLALAIWRRSRPMLFAWCFILFSVLPFIFVPHYSGFFLYLPIAGWALYFATTIEMLRERFAKAVPAVVVVLLVALVLAPLHARESLKSMQVFTTADLPTTEMIAQLQRVKPSLPKGAYLFFESDPFPPKTFSLVFLVRLVYDDLTVQVARAKDGDPLEGGHFDAVLRWDDGKLSVVPR
jgi:Dolichyl-phosphate-mannose-protein mannosyltransferase